MTIDLLKEMPQITGEIGRIEADLPAPSTLRKALDRLEMSSVECSCVSRRSCTIPPSTPPLTPRSTNETAPAAYCHCTNYRVRTLKVTKLVDTESQAVLNVHCSTTLKGSDADLCEQIARRNAGDLQTLAADKGYDKNALRERLREFEIRPLIKH